MSEASKHLHSSVVAEGMGFEPMEALRLHSDLNRAP